MEECNLLEDTRKPVERNELGAWKTRHILKPLEKKKGPVEPGKELLDELETFFSHIHEFLNPAPSAPVSVCVPVVVPARFVINFVPAPTYRKKTTGLGQSGPENPPAQRAYFQPHLENRRSPRDTDNNSLTSSGRASRRHRSHPKRPENTFFPKPLSSFLPSFPPLLPPFQKSREPGGNVPTGANTTDTNMALTQQLTHRLTQQDEN